MNSIPYAVVSRPRQEVARDLAEVTLGYGMILAVLWVPEPVQRFFGPVALVTTLLVVLMRCRDLGALGLSTRGLVRPLWILPAAAVVTVASVLIAKRVGTLHSLYVADFIHVGGYVLWTIIQQFLLQNYFMPRLLRILPGEQAAISLAAFLFAAAHLPNLVLTAATMVWGAISCAIFLRYRSIYVLGLTQGLLGLCFAVCVPEVLHHHMRVGLGYLHY
jgi:hypothetical protein